MKKLLASLLVLAMCAPAMALTLSTSGAGTDTLVINYSVAAGETLRGLALTVTNVSGDGAVVDDQGHNYGEFNTFMDFAADVDNTYTAVGQGHPFAMITPDVVNGQYEAAFPASSFALSLGFLDEDQDDIKGEGIQTSGSISIKFTGTTDTTVAVALDTFRGGAVGDALVVDDSGLQNVQLTFGPACKGDFDGNNLINSNDISKVVNYWLNNKNFLGVAQCNLTDYVEGMDGDGNNLINSNDISLVVNHWLNTKNFLGVAPCMP